MLQDKDLKIKKLTEENKQLKEKGNFDTGAKSYTVAIP